MRRLFVRTGLLETSFRPSRSSEDADQYPKVAFQHPEDADQYPEDAFQYQNQHPKDAESHLRVSFWRCFGVDSTSIATYTSPKHITSSAHPSRVIDRFAFSLQV